MPISTAPVTGSYVPPDGSTIVGGQIVFALSGPDTEGDTVVSGETIATLDGADLPAGFELWRNTAGGRGTYYKVRVKVYISHVTAGGTFQTERSYQLGNVQVGDAVSYTLTELLNNPVPDEPGWNVNIDPTEWAALQADFDAADTAATNASASATAAGNSATAAAGSATAASASAVAAAASADDASAAGAYAAAASDSADDAAASAADAASEAAAAAASAIAAAVSETAANDSAADAATDAGLALTRANAAGTSATAAASSAGAASGSATAAAGSATAAAGSATAAAASATAAAGSAVTAGAASGYASAAAASAQDAADEAAAAAASAVAAAASEATASNAASDAATDAGLALTRASAAAVSASAAAASQGAAAGSATAAAGSATAASGSATAAAASATAAAGSAVTAGAASGYASAAAASAQDAADEAAAAAASAVAAAASEATASNAASDAATDAGLALTRASAAAVSASAAAASQGAAAGSATAAAGSATAASGSATAAAASATAAAGSAVTAGAAQGYATAAAASADDAAAEAAAAQSYASDAAASALAAAASEGAANIDAAQAVSAANDAADSAADAEAAKVAAEAARDEIRELYVTLEDFGAVGDGVTPDNAAFAAAAAAGGDVWATQGKTYLISAPITVRGATDFCLRMDGATIQMAEGCNAVYRFYEYTNVGIDFGATGRLIGNYDTDGAWASFATTPGITSGSRTGTASTAYIATTTTITINGLGVGYVKKGYRLSHINGGTTYSYIVTADAAITAGSATVTLDHGLEAPISNGQLIYLNFWNNRWVVASAVGPTDTQITLEMANVTSADGNPRILAGTKFSFHDDYNNIDSIDYTKVCTVAIGGSVTGSYPAKTVTVTLTAPMGRSVPAGTMGTSIMDYYNNEQMPILFYGGTGGFVRGANVSNLRLHGFGQACINAPWDGANPATKPNIDLKLEGNVDTSTNARGALCVAAWSTRGLSIKHNRGTYALGQLRSVVQVERSDDFDVAENSIYGGQYLCRINGECSDGRITGNRGIHMMRFLQQGNTSTRLTFEGNTGSGHADYTDYMILVLSGMLDEDGASAGSVLRLNSTKVVGNVFNGPTRTTGAAGYGSHIVIGPQNLDAAADEEDWPRQVWVFGNTSTGATYHGIFGLNGNSVTYETNFITGSGLAGIYVKGGDNSDLLSNEVADCCVDTPGKGIVLDGATNVKLDGNKTTVDTGTGMDAGLSLINRATLRGEDNNDWTGTVTSGGLSLMAKQSRADLVALCAYGWRAADGQIVTAGGVPMIGVTGSTVIADLPGLEYFVMGATEAAAMRAMIGANIGTNVQAWDAELAAIAALTGAADKVPMFTAPGAASLITITAAARTLLDDPDTATMRTTLGLVPTAAQDDTTAGRLLKVGDHGLGVTTGAGAPQVTLATAVKSGLWSYAAADPAAPVAGQSGSVLVLRGSAATTVRQIAMTGTPTREYTRVSADNGATWSAWDRSFAQSNLVGTVSQSGGAVTGDAFERNSNGNGRWWKTADGTMRVARDDFLVAGITTADGGVYRSASVTWTFPQAFAAPPIPRFASLDAQTWAVVESVSNTSVTFRVLSTVSKNFARLSCEAIGRWFAAGVTSPADLFSSGQKGVWYDFSNPATLFSDTARTTLLTASGQQVAGIADLSGNGVHLQQATSTKRPVYTVGSDGRSYLSFDGVDDCLASIVNLDLAASQVTILAAFRKLVDVTTAVMLELSDIVTSNNGAFALFAPSNVGGNYDNINIYSRGATTTVSRPVQGLAAPLTCVAVFIADTVAPLISNRVNKGTELTTATTQGGGNFGAYPLRVGARGASGTSPFGGWISEIIIREGILSEGDITSLTEYLYAKAGA